MIYILETNKHIHGIGGLGVSSVNTDLFGRAIDYVYSTRIGSLHSPSLYSDISRISTKIVEELSSHNSVYWREVLVDVGYFDEKFELNEDTNLNHKIRSKGYKLLLEPKAYVFHHRKKSIKEFAEKFFSYGVGRMRSILTNKEYLDASRISPLMATLTFLGFVYLNRLISISFLLAYLLAMFCYGLKGAYAKREKWFLLFVPILLITQHFCYSLGLFLGIFKGKWKESLENIECSIHSRIIMGVHTSSARDTF